MPNVKLSKLKPNPDNPRVIKDEAFHKLVANILTLPKALEKRPIVHAKWVIQGGNQRYKAIQHIVALPETEFNELTHKLGLTNEELDMWTGVRKTKAMPAEWVSDASAWTADELEAFIALDNVNAGDWDWGKLSSSWKADKLVKWGVMPTTSWAANKAARQPGGTAEGDAGAFRDGGITPENKFAVIVYCDDEAQQQKTFEELQAEGRKCKVVVV